MNDVFQHDNTVDHGDQFLLFLSALFLLMHQFTKDGRQRKTVEQHIERVLFFAKTRNFVVTQRWFHAHF
jgi:hypothetical protein